MTLYKAATSGATRSTRYTRYVPADIEDVVAEVFAILAHTDEKGVKAILSVIEAGATALRIQDSTR